MLSIRRSFSNKLLKLNILKGIVNDKAIICLEIVKLKRAKMQVFEYTKIWDAAKKAHIFISGLPTLNSFHMLTQDTKSNHLKQKYIYIYILLDKNTIVDQK